MPLVITDSGAAFDDSADETGFVHDDDRTSYLAAHLGAVADAQAKGADVRGYFAWSLMDNFEWGHGYDKRFGLVRVDYDTQIRTPKQSAVWYRDAIRHWRTTQ
jgi:beta-glucosidase